MSVLEERLVGRAVIQVVIAEDHAAGGKVDFGEAEQVGTFRSGSE